MTKGKMASVDDEKIRRTPHSFECGCSFYLILNFQMCLVKTVLYELSTIQGVVPF